MLGALGALNLNYPFVADQVVAMIGAKTIAAGGTLYLDFWDNKMPGLFWFYCLAGHLFGYTEFGVHLLELIWMLVFAVVLLACLRTYVLFPWMSALPALAVVGTYYVAVDPFHLTQVEGMVGLPMFLSAWFAAQVSPDVKHVRFALLLSGVFAGLSVVFKLVFAPLFVAFWLIVSIHALIQHRLAIGTIILNIWLPAACGVLLILTGVAIKFWFDGVLWELYWTAFLYPPAALASSPPAPYMRLFTSSLFFVSYFSVWALFIVLAWAEWWAIERHLITSLMTGWLVVGLVLILIQRFSWWPYHFLLIFAPAGILAARGVCVVPRALLQRGLIDKQLSGFIMVALLFPAVLSLAVPANQKIAAHVEIFDRKGDVDDFKRFINVEYGRIGQSVRFLSSDTARPGKIYVMGDPLTYHLSGREPALPIIGWPWKYFLQSQWVNLPRQLDEALPPYIYIGKDARELIAIRGGGMREFIGEHYVPFNADAHGTWYQVQPSVWKARHNSNPSN